MILKPKRSIKKDFKFSPIKDIENVNILLKSNEISNQIYDSDL
jgi:hypothetical protein